MPQLQHETCTVPGCTRSHKARGYCQTHYVQWRRGAEIIPEINARDRNPPETCVEEGCVSPVQAKGLCQMHYARLLRHGHTRYPDRKKPPKICTVNGCTDWLYAKGLCHVHYIRRRKHREVYGTTSEAVAKMEAAQDGRCASCRSLPMRRDTRSGRPLPLDVDHNHTTGVVRGLLCSPCNRGIGLMQDDPLVLAAAIRYLAKHSPDPRAVIAAVIEVLSA